jgi:cytidylate kinase
MSLNIAIDGPAGAGKSTIAKAIANKLNIIYIDTGAMYRAVGLKALKNNIDTKNEKDLTRLVSDIDIGISHNPDGEQLIFLDKENVSDKIRTQEISTAASNVSKFSAVRLRLVELQREIAECNDVVMDGRDIGTFVLPNANFKFFLTADIDERAKRRFKELVAKGNTKIIFEEVKKEMAYRDDQDRSRELAPLKQAEDAILVDTTNLNIGEVIGRIYSYLDYE